jgi:hypothetical protein
MSNDLRSEQRRERKEFTPSDRRVRRRFRVCEEDAEACRRIGVAVDASGLSRPEWTQSVDLEITAPRTKTPAVILFSGFVSFVSLW